MRMISIQIFFILNLRTGIGSSVCPRDLPSMQSRDHLHARNHPTRGTTSREEPPHARNHLTRGTTRSASTTISFGDSFELNCATRPLPSHASTDILPFVCQLSLVVCSC